MFFHRTLTSGIRKHFERRAMSRPATRKRRTRPAPARLDAEALEQRVVMSASSVAPVWFENLQTEADSAQPPAADAEPIMGPAVETSVDQWIVQVSNASRFDSVGEVQAVFDSAGVSAQVVEGLGQPGLVLVETPGVASLSIQSWMATSADIQFFEPNATIQLSPGDLTPTATPNDPLFGSLWGLHNTGQTGGTADADIDAPEAWDVSQGSADIVIGVIDTGVDYNHPDLAPNMWVNPGEIPGNGRDDDGNGFVDDVHGYDFANNDGDPMDDHYHGTHVAGTVAAKGNNGAGVAGVSWNSKIMALKFLSASGSGSTSDAIQAVNYATMMRERFNVNVRATNNSWGGGLFSSGLKDAIDNSGDAGMLFVAAAGNNGRNTDHQPMYPASYSSPNIISVAASDHNDQLRSFSNYGVVTVDVAAPGSSILSTVPGAQYGSLSGTSMAAPHVSGLVALALSVDRDASGAEIKQAILDNADHKPHPGRGTLTNGRINARRTLDSLDDGDVNPPSARFIAASVAPKQSEALIAVVYQDESGVDIATVGNGDVFVTGPRGYSASATFVRAGELSGGRVLAIYSIPGPGGFWGREDNGSYGVRMNANQVRDLNGNAVPAGPIGGFQVNLQAIDGFGVYRDGLFFQDTGSRGYDGEEPFAFGLPGDLPVAGDWDGDGVDQAGVFRDGWFFLDQGAPGYDGELPIQFGLPGDLPVAGDWNGDGIDEVGVFRPDGGLFFLDTGPSGYNGEEPFQFGLPGDRPVAGDWNGDGLHDVGVMRSDGVGTYFYLDTGPLGYNGEEPFQFGLHGDYPVAGDWDGDGIHDVGVFRPNGGLFFADEGPRGYNGETPFQFGLSNDLPIAGDWSPAGALSDSLDSFVASALDVVDTDTISQTVSVTGSGLDGLDPAALSNLSVEAVGPNAQRLTAELADVDRLSTDSVRLEFTVVAQNATWTAADNGAWSIEVNGQSVGAFHVSVDESVDEYQSLVARDDKTGIWYQTRWNGTSLETVQAGAWSPGVDWVNVGTADVNGDGHGDVVGQDPKSGAWWVGLSDGSSFTNQRWGRWAPIGWVDVNVADVNGDGNDDIVGRQESNGVWWVALSNGTNGFTNQRWGGWAPIGWVDVNVADVNGDGNDDVVGRQESNGAWWVALSNGTNGFTNQRWGGWAPIDWVDVNIADVNGDGNDDIVGRQESNGAWWVGLSNGTNGFTNQRWGGWAPIDWVDVNIADVNGDGSDDIVGRQESNGVWWVGLSNGTNGFTNQRWGGWAPIGWEDVTVADIDGDGRDDIVGRQRSNGNRWAARSDGTRFTNERHGQWDSAAAWADVGSISGLLDAV